MTPNYRNSLIKDLSVGMMEKISSLMRADKPMFSRINPFSTNIWGNTDRRVNIDQNLQLNTDWIYTCISLRAERCASLDWHLEQEFNRADQNEIKYHPMYDLFGDMDDEYTDVDFLFLLEFGYELLGRAAFYVQMNGLNRPQRIIPIFPEMGRFTKRMDAFGVVEKYILFTGKDVLEFEPNEIFFYRALHLSDATYGVGWVNACLRLAQMDRFQKEHAIKLFENGAQPSAVLTTKRVLNPTTLAQEAQKYQELYGSVMNAHKLWLLDGETTPFTVGLNQKELDFVNSLAMTKEQIIAMARIPAGLLGMSSASRAEAETLEMVFMEHTISPLIKIRDSRMTKLFAQRYYPPSRGTLRVVTDLPDYEDQSVKAVIAQTNVAAQMQLLQAISSGALPVDTGRIVFQKNYPELSESDIEDILKPIEDDLLEEKTESPEEKQTEIMNGEENQNMPNMKLDGNMKPMNPAKEINLLDNQTQKA